MAKSNKELAVDLACACITTISSRPSPTHKPLTFDDINNIVHDCFNVVKSLDSDEPM